MNALTAGFDALRPTDDLPLLLVNGALRGTHPGIEVMTRDGETEIRVTADVRLVILTDTVCDSHLTFTVEREAHLRITHVTLANGGSHHVLFDLVGTGGSVECATLVATSGGLTTYAFTTRHRAAHTSSVELARCVATGSGRINWHGHVGVIHEAAGSIVRQDNKNLLLSDEAYISAQPELDIAIDDITASHGSATGSLDATALLYLGARGISAPEARRLLTLAFADRILAKLPEDMRALVIRQFSANILSA